MSSPIDRTRPRGLILRAAASIAVLAAAASARTVWLPAGTIEGARFAGRQFESSDTAAVAANVGIHAVGAVGPLIAVAAVLILAAIWLAPLRRALRRLACVAAVLAAASATQAHAYFDTQDRAEALTIMPNESAFWIPDIGDNKDAQAQADTEQFYNERKVYLKRFVIPHMIFQNSGGVHWFSKDYYVPQGRLIIVNRSPYNREWVKDTNRGTSRRDEAMRCQSKEGLNITAEISVGASVSEQNAAKFLHFFGVKDPAGDRGDPAVIFTSVYYSRSLTDVMDGVGRGLIQTAVCHELGSRTLDDDNAQYTTIMDQIRQTASSYLGDRGVTLEYIGWAGTFTFDDDVQRGINDAYTGRVVAPVLATLQQKAAIDALEGWDRHLPNTLTLLGDTGIGQVLNALRPTR